jgi:hypothetical protein
MKWRPLKILAFASWSRTCRLYHGLSVGPAKRDVKSHLISELGISWLTESEPSELLRKLPSGVKGLHREGEVVLAILSTDGLLTRMLLQAIHQVNHARLKRSFLGGQVEAPPSLDLGKRCNSTKKKRWGSLNSKKAHKLRAAITTSFFLSHHQRPNSHHEIISEWMLDLQAQTSQMRPPNPYV